MNRTDRIARGTTPTTVTMLDGSTVTATWWSDAPRVDGRRYSRGTTLAWYATDDGRAVYATVNPLGVAHEEPEPAAWRVERDAARYGTRRVAVRDLRIGDVIVRGQGFLMGYTVACEPHETPRYGDPRTYVSLDEPRGPRWPYTRYLADDTVDVVDYPTALVA